MHATRCKGPVIVVEHPPLAGVAAVRDCREAAELRLVTTCRDRLDHLGREQALAVDLAAVQHQLPESPEIAKTRRHAAAGEGHALAVDGLVGILLGAHTAARAVRRPDRSRPCPVTRLMIHPSMSELIVL